MRTVRADLHGSGQTHNAGVKCTLPNMCYMLFTRESWSNALDSDRACAVDSDRTGQAADWP